MPRRLLAVAAVVVLGPLAPLPAAATDLPGPALVVDAATVDAGSTVSYTGEGFQVSSEDLPCEFTSTVDMIDLECALDGPPIASFTVPATVLAGSYAFQLCVPRCDSPWAGRSDGTLQVIAPTSEPVEPISEPPPPGRAVSGDAHPASMRARMLAVDPPGSGIVVSPDPAEPGDFVVVYDELLPAPNGECLALWAGETVADPSCTVDADGLVTGTITVPESAPDGPLRFVVCRPDCEDPDGRTATGVVTVQAQPVDVPDLSGLTTAEAARVLEPLDLVVQPSTGDGVIAGQDPPAGTSVRRGTVVTVVLDAVPPDPVTVPLLLGSDVAQAEAAVLERGLVIVGATGDGEVTAQDPAAGTLVAPGSAVRVTLSLVRPSTSSTASGPGTSGAGASWPLVLLGVGILLLVLAVAVIRTYVLSPSASPVPKPAPQPGLRPVGAAPTVTTEPWATAPRVPTLGLRPRRDLDPTVVLEVGL